MMNNYMPLLDHLNGQTSRKTNLRNQIRRNRNESIINKQLKQVIKNNPQRKIPGLGVFDGEIQRKI